MAIERAYRDAHGRIMARMIRLTGDFDVAEEVVHEAFVAAAEQWGQAGPPTNPVAWLIRVARNKAIDRVRKRERWSSTVQPLIIHEDHEEPEASEIPDDRLRLVFTCCHPSLSVEAQVALTLRTLCGLTTEEIARAFLVPTSTMAQRIVRAKQKIRAAAIPYRVPSAEALPARLGAVMAVAYLVFNEGYGASEGESLIRTDLCSEAIVLAQLLVELLPGEAEAKGLLALMLLHHSRRYARVGPGGELVLLEDQDRTRWNQEEIRRGLALVEPALRGRPPGPYALQAAIAALHAQAATPEQTDWPQIASLYAVLIRLHPSPVVELNHAVAVAMVDGPERGLRLIDALGARTVLDGYHLFHAARADLLRRLGRDAQASESYARALELAGTVAERTFLQRRLVECLGVDE